MALSTIQFRNNEEVGHKEKNPDDGKEKGVSKERPSSINSMPFQKSSVTSNENSQEDGTLLELPSPISRHGSLVGDPQLPVPTEFLDVSKRPKICLIMNLQLSKISPNNINIIYKKQ